MRTASVFVDILQLLRKLHLDFYRSVWRQNIYCGYWVTTTYEKEPVTSEQPPADPPETGIPPSSVANRITKRFRQPHLECSPISSGIDSSILMPAADSSLTVCIS
ncbi:hypothetical protein CEXT_459611 [Caerostris extrusa]|uniref:Uncharacterized protein n=1 Tax=Caerostris extrusa TaxID=172846 RepID=A0AAV4QUL2_CAEEX|nr:hypothetical protein CEXT_459611 [Caerostris extrusa]